MDPSCFYVCGLCEPQESEEAPSANGYRGHSPFVLDVDEEPEHLTLALEAVNCDDPRRAARYRTPFLNCFTVRISDHLNDLESVGWLEGTDPVDQWVKLI